MIRTPTPAAELAKITDWETPPAGFFAMRRFKGGPLLPVMIWCHQVIDEDTGELAEPERMRALLAGEEVALSRVWPHCGHRPISREEYFRRLGQCDPEKPVDLSSAPTRPPKR